VVKPEDFPLPVVRALAVGPTVEAASMVVEDMVAEATGNSGTAAA
jgi:hypothetical protein